MDLREALYETEHELRKLQESTLLLVRALYAATSEEIAQQALKDQGATEEELTAVAKFMAERA